MAPPAAQSNRRIDQGPDGDGAAVVRRAPFSDNPRVGARGQRAQQRILDAALRVFGEEGYHRCGVIRITEVAGCSRAAFYQYFSSKEDVFRHLAGQVARQLTASAEALATITPGADGWTTLRAWVERHADIYERYEPVFDAYQAAAESDEVVASGAARIGERNVAAVAARLASTSLPSRHVDPVIAVLLDCMTRTNHTARVLRRPNPSAYARDRVNDALSDIAHRTLFGLDPEVNVHPPARRRPPRLELGPIVRRSLSVDEPPAEVRPAGARTLATLLQAGHEVLVTRGYHGTRVDDITDAAGVSHGAFYRYFDNKDQLVQLLAVRAMRTVSLAFAGIPDIADSAGPASSAALRQWLRRYNKTQAAETAMIRVWLDATADDPGLSLESAAALDWGRRRMVRFLRPRGFGDVDTEAVVLVSLVESFGAPRRMSARVDAAAHIIERGLLGRK